MEVDSSIVTYLAATFYNITPAEDSIKPICGYLDRNFSFTDVLDEQRKYFLKIVDESESSKELTDVIDKILHDLYEPSICTNPNQFLFPRLIRTSADRPSALATIRQRNTSECDYENKECNVKLFDFQPGITLTEFINNHRDKYAISELFFKLGKLSGKLSNMLRTKQHLLDQLKKARGDNFMWQLTNGDKIIQMLLNRNRTIKITDHQRQMIAKVVEEFKSIKHKIIKLPETILHGDLSPMNMLINLDEPERIYLVDFQDLQVGPEVIDLTLLIVYSIIMQDCIELRDALRLIPSWIWSGYKSSSEGIAEGDLELVPILIKLRLCQSLLNGIISSAKDPSNEYIMCSSERINQLLELMVSQTRTSNSLF